MGRPKRVHGLRDKDDERRPVAVTQRDAKEQLAYELDRTAKAAAIEAAGGDPRRVVRDEANGGYRVVNEPIWGHRPLWVCRGRAGRSKRYPPEVYV
jgi:hypothetical protein